MSYPKLTPIIAKGATEPRYLEDRFANVVNVKDFGAKGDGVTDDTQKIQDAINAGTGKTVYFPSGVYIVDLATSISIPTNTRIVGSGYSTTTVKTNKTTQQGDNWLFKANGNNISIEMLEFDGGRNVSNITMSEGRPGLIWHDDVYGFSGLTVSDCYIHDFRFKTIYTLANNTAVKNCKFERCSKWIHDLGPMAGVICNYTTSTTALANPQIHDIYINNCSFDWCGQFACLWMNTAGIIESNLVVTNASGIGVGHQWCEDISIKDSIFRYTYMNGVDCQQCSRQVISGCHFYMSGYMTHDLDSSDNLCQSIYAGNDGPYNSETNRPSKDIVISDNVIEGGWNKDLINATAPEQWYSVGTGIVVVQADNVVVKGNTIRNLGIPYTSQSINNEDGMGIKISNNCKNVIVNSNSIFSVKGKGIWLGIGNFVNSVISDNVISIHGDEGIMITANAYLKSLSVCRNSINDALNIYNREVAAAIYCGTFGAHLDNVHINENNILSTDYNSTNLTHGIYIGKTYTGDGGTFCGLGNHEVKNNFASNFSVALVAYGPGVSTQGATRHWHAVDGNRQGTPIAGSGTGIVDNVPNSDTVCIRQFPSQTVPSTGTHKQGDIAWNPFPGSNNILCWVCTASGTPGTWKKITLVSLDN